MEIAWGAFALANVGSMLRMSRWETIPFHFVWVSLTLVYGRRVWRLRTTAIVLAAVVAATGGALMWTILARSQLVDEIAEVPLMAAMFVAMMWHATRSERATEEVRRMARSEHRLLERQRDFVRDASHELRTPITVARGHAELIRAADLTPQVTEDVDVVLDELSRLARIAERLLILAAAEHPGFLVMTPVEVTQLVGNAARRWSSTVSRRWGFHAAAEGWITADGERLDAALDALIENAVKFTREGDRIAVSAFPDGAALVLEVLDSGAGIAGEDLDRVFDRFSRADQDRARGSGGTGLGLAIVKAIVEAHGGTVGLESEVSRGTKVWVRLPGFRANPAPALPGPVEPAPALGR